MVRNAGIKHFICFKYFGENVSKERKIVLVSFWFCLGFFVWWGFVGFFVWLVGFLSVFVCGFLGFFLLKRKFLERFGSHG